MKDQELLAKVHSLCERLREIIQDGFDEEISNRLKSKNKDGIVPDVCFVLDWDRNDKFTDELDSFFCDIADEVHRKLCDDARDRCPVAFLNPNSIR